jgi:hypothetical protein
MTNYDRITGPLPFGNMSGPVEIAIDPNLYIILDVVRGHFNCALVAACVSVLLEAILGSVF